MKLHEGKVRCLGGLRLLVEFKNKKQAIMARDEFHGCTEHFESTEIWEGQHTNFERIAWLKVFGIPLSITDNKVIDDVGSLFGKVVKGARVDRAGLDISFQFIGVLVNHGSRVQEEAFVRWRGKNFKVWVSEDTNDWLEEFIGEPVDVSDDCPMVKEDVSSPENGSPEESLPEVRPVFPVNGVNVQDPGKETGGDFNANDCLSNFGGEFPFSNKDTSSTVGEEIMEVGPVNCLKRKKNKKHLVVDQSSSGGYPSSNERPIKEPRMEEEDPFVLDPIIMGFDSNVVKTRGPPPI
ncbi:hypothetical protein HanPI659440_Chr05g0189831 [Helianthus annuus]|nr:hypothetical protein HanPI659440_Chr05g0189831 [Helianthus annuus]